MVPDFNKKRKGEFSWSKFLLPIGGVFLVAIMVALVLVDFNMYRKRKELISKVEFYQNQIDEIEKSNKELRNEIDNADNIEYLEKIAYEQLGEQKPGEKAVIFIAPEQNLEEQQELESFWTGWLGGLLNRIKNWF